MHSLPAQLNVAEDLLYRFKGGPRLEFLRGDNNISPWAIRMRLGSEAIAAAVAQTEFAARFDKFVDNYQIKTQFGSRVEALNSIPVDDEGCLYLTDALRASIRYQTVLAETFLSKEMGNLYGTPPEEQLEIAEDLIDYCNDVLTAADQRLHVSELARQPDWAAKTDLIFQSIARDQAKEPDQARSPTDWKSRGVDILYDRILVYRDPETGDPTIEKKGPAYKIRDEKQGFRLYGLYTSPGTGPPEDSRAGLRAWLLRNFVAINCDWDAMTLSGPVRINLGDVTATSLAPQEAAKLAHARRRSV